jgi:hypothetical protein
MANQLTSNEEALRLFFTEDVYLVKNDDKMPFNSPAKENIGLPISEAQAIIKTEEVILPQVPLVDVKTQAEPKTVWNFEHLGKNQKGILILVNDSVNKVSSTQGTELLRKLVKAIELTNNDFALVNYANYLEAKFEHLDEFFKCKLLLAFGVEPKSLALPEHTMHQLHTVGSTRLVFTTNLHDLDSDQASKKILWNTLQQLK